MNPNPRERTRLSLQGLALGDAFGERYFVPVPHALSLIEQRALPGAAIWKWTDDTAMATAIVAVLERHGEIDRDALAAEFARRYALDRHRGYGGGAHDLLEQLGAGADWREAARQLFDGGSYGNGGAMRSGPIGAWFADDLDRVVTEAGKSADPTHAHPEGRAGAIAVAVAAAVAARPAGTLDLFDTVLRLTPRGEVHNNVAAAARLGPEASVDDAVRALGNGSRVSAQDTVGFALWCAHRHLDDYEEAMWTTVRGLGDRDTTCAIAGGIVALRVGDAGLPASWLAHLEPLDL